MTLYAAEQKTILVTSTAEEGDGFDQSGHSEGKPITSQATLIKVKEIKRLSLWSSETCTW